MIPKKIHYVWVGDKPKPQFVLDCIETWKRLLPDYDIFEWGNESIKHIKNKYMLEAIHQRKWAFASDYIRLYALYHEGGIYLDTDVEVTNNLDDFLHLDFFSCYEKSEGYYPVTSAVMGAQKQDSMIGDLLKLYEDAKFETDQGLNLETNIIKITNYIQHQFGLLPPYDGTQTTQLNERTIIFPSHYFCTPELNKENFAIHHFNGSWLPSHTRKDKLTLFNKLIFSRFVKIRDKGEPELTSKEKLILSLPLSKTKSYALILKKQ